MAKREVLTPVAKANAYTLAAEQIKERILDGTWRPGDKLPSERDLAAQLAISRGSTREALRILEAIGWLEIKPGEGAIVTDAHRQPFDSADLPLPAIGVGDIWETRKILEPQAAYLAAERCNQSDLLTIENDLRQTETYAEDGRQLDVFKANSSFHLGVATASGNPIIVHFQTLLVEIEQKTVQSRPTDADSTLERSTDSLVEHRKIFEAIAAGRPKEAEEAAFDHLVNSWMAKWAAKKANQR